MPEDQSSDRPRRLGDRVVWSGARVVDIGRCGTGAARSRKARGPKSGNRYREIRGQPFGTMCRAFGLMNQSPMSTTKMSMDSRDVTASNLSRTHRAVGVERACAAGADFTGHVRNMNDRSSIGIRSPLPGSRR